MTSEQTTSDADGLGLILERVRTAKTDTDLLVVQCQLLLEILAELKKAAR